MNGCFLERAGERNLGQPRPLIPSPSLPGPLLFPSDQNNTQSSKTRNIAIPPPSQSLTTQAQKFREKEAFPGVKVCEQYDDDERAQSREFSDTCAHFSRWLGGEGACSNDNNEPATAFWRITFRRFWRACGWRWRVESMHPRERWLCGGGAWCLLDGGREWRKACYDRRSSSSPPSTLQADVIFWRHEGVFALARVVPFSVVVKDLRTQEARLRK